MPEPRLPDQWTPLRLPPASNLLDRAAEPRRVFSIMESRYALLLCCLSLAACASHPLEPFDSLFDTAVEAYYKGDWLTVILNMEKALRNKATVRSVKAQCRLGCANQTAFGGPSSGPGAAVPGAGSVEDLGFFQKILKRADCVNSCEAEKLGTPTVHWVTAEVELEFKKRTPYNYLQVAYFKVIESRMSEKLKLTPINVVLVKTRHRSQVINKTQLDTTKKKTSPETIAKRATSLRWSPLLWRLRVQTFRDPAVKRPNVWPSNATYTLTFSPTRSAGVLEYL